MPRGSLKKSELENLVLKMKNELYDGTWSHKNGEWHDGAHEMLNKVLHTLEEYRE